jgi:hypothetical protein
LSVTAIAALNAAAELGVKVTERLQFAPAASVAPHPLVKEKTEGFAPLRTMPVMFRVAVPGFESLTIWTALVDPVV